MLISRLRNSAFRPDEGEVKSLNNIHALFEGNASAQPLPPPPVAETPRAAVSEETLNALDKQTAEEKTEKQQTQQPEPQNSPEQAATPQPVIELKGEEAPHDIPQSAPAPIKPITESPNPSLSAGFPTLPDIGNVMLGIVRDPRSKSLQNILVEVVDVNNVPVRTFKTNALGQFSAATPLSNGTYKVIFEDPAKQHEFQPVEAVLDGSIFQPLDIKSIDAREKLRQELFGAPAAAA
jgi:hypothetical protein